MFVIQHKINIQYMNVLFVAKKQAQRSYFFYYY